MSFHILLLLAWPVMGVALAMRLFFLFYALIEACVRLVFGGGGGLRAL